MVKTITTALAMLVLASSVGRADTLLLDGIEMDKQTATMRPKAGMSMTAVESTDGAPAERRSAVGEPPITQGRTFVREACARVGHVGRGFTCSARAEAECS